MHTRRRRSHEVPGFASVPAAPESCGVCIHGLWILRIEHKEIHNSAQIEHPPGLAAVMGDVGTRHVAGNEHRIHVMWADGRVEHCAAAAGANHAEIPWPFRPGAGKTEKEADSDPD